jgi:hypothetical protein
VTKLVDLPNPPDRARLSPEERRAMRIAGWVLLLAGVVLCLSVAWAALGFLLMGIGLVALQVAERTRRKAEKSAANAVADARPEPAATFAEASAAPAEHATVGAEAPLLPAPEAVRNADDSAYDRDAWRLLVQSDPDLAQLAAVLADYGQHYVDEFAGSYLAQPDKSRLGAIVNEIIANAGRKDSALAAPAPNVPEPSADANQPPGSSIVQSEPARNAPKLDAPKVAAIPRAEQGVGAKAAAMAPHLRIAPTDKHPEQNPEHGNDSGIPRDEDFSELIRKFANDASFLRR